MAGNSVSARHDALHRESAVPEGSREPVEDERNAFVRDHLGFVWRALRRLGLADADAADATQRVFLTATARLQRIEPGRERAFLFGTALRIVANFRRTAARKPSTPFGADADADDYPAEQPTAEDLVDRKRARDVLDAILDGMTDDLRAVFVLYELEQMTMEEIADMLALPAGTVASRLRRGREYFQERVTRRARGPGETR
jgi:RNA polymerase sigma-70 factor (ECF subfamily)